MCLYADSEERFKMSDNFGLFYRKSSAKNQAERVIPCLHGIESHSGAFNFMGKQLSDANSEVYAFDRRGFGNSVEPGLPRGDTSDFNRHMTDLKEVADIVRVNYPGKNCSCLHTA